MIKYINFDLLRMQTAKTAAEEFLQHETRLDMLINNAGIVSIQTIKVKYLRQRDRWLLPTKLVQMALKFKLVMEQVRCFTRRAHFRLLMRLSCRALCADNGSSSYSEGHSLKTGISRSYCQCNEQRISTSSKPKLQDIGRSEPEVSIDLESLWQWKTLSECLHLCRLDFVDSIIEHTVYE